MQKGTHNKNKNKNKIERGRFVSTLIRRTDRAVRGRFRKGKKLNSENEIESGN